MKFLLGIFISIFTLACKNKIKTNHTFKVIKDSLQVKSDSFNTQDLEYHPSLQKDILLDTINIPSNKKHLEGTIIFPKLSEKNYPEIYKQISTLIKDKKKDFEESDKDEKVVYDSLMEAYQGWSMWIEPKSLYWTKKIISFGIESGEGYSGMPSGFEYKTINFDLAKRRQVFLKDYFVLNSRSDTTYLEKIIGRAINRDFSIKKYEGDWGGHINFSLDDSFVYFYFDKYDLLGWGIFSIKKKYILEHINSIYR